MNELIDVILAAVEKMKGRIDALSVIAQAKQDALVSGTNIKTVNGASILGAGDIIISAGASKGYIYFASRG